MKNFSIGLLFISTIILIPSNLSYAIVEEQDIEVEINVSENYSIYFIKWKINVDVNYYYPAGSEFMIVLPKNYEILSVRDDLEDVEFKISNSNLIVYNRRNVYHGDNYRFYITIKQNYNPIYYNKSFYFRSLYSSIPIKINLPTWAKDVKIISGKNYTTYLNYISTNYPISITFRGKEMEEEIINLNLDNINVEIPKRYKEKLIPILDKIDRYYWNKFEEIFSNGIDKIFFNLVTNEQEDWLCYYRKNSISCSIDILFYDEYYIAKTIVHEISHHFISKNIGDGLTTWLEEGIAEKISYEFCNFTKDEIDRSKIIKECLDVLNNDFWSSWTCEKFNNCNVTYYSNNSCILAHGLENLRYIFSFEIVNRTLTLEDIKEISKFFRENKIFISTSSENKDSIAVFLIYLFGRGFEEIKNYKINFDNLTRVRNLYALYNDARRKIEIYSENLPKNIFKDAKQIVESSLNIIFNGYLDEAEKEINKALYVADEIKINAEKIREDILNIEKILNSCYYVSPYSFILEASLSYEKGDLNKSIEYIKKALEEKEIIDKRIEKIETKIDKLKSSFASIIFSEKIKSIERDFKNCKIEKVETDIKDIEMNLNILLLSMLLSLLSAIIILFCFVYKNIKKRCRK